MPQGDRYVHSVHRNALRDAQKDEPSCDKHKK